MLSATICESYTRAIEERTKKDGVRIPATGESTGRDSAIGHRAGAVLFATDASTFVAHAELAQEVFGPSSLIVFCESIADFVRCAESLHGQLTATIWAEGEIGDNSDLLFDSRAKSRTHRLQRISDWRRSKFGDDARGAFPATTDSRFTSVGARSICRFVQPVAWQTPAA